MCYTHLLMLFCSACLVAGCSSLDKSAGETSKKSSSILNPDLEVDTNFLLYLEETFSGNNAIHFSEEKITVYGRVLPAYLTIELPDQWAGTLIELKFVPLPEKDGIRYVGIDLVTCEHVSALDSNAVSPSDLERSFSLLIGNEPDYFSQVYGLNAWRKLHTNQANRNSYFALANYTNSSYLCMQLEKFLGNTVSVRVPNLEEISRICTSDSYYENSEFWWIKENCDVPRVRSSRGGFVSILESLTLAMVEYPSADGIYNAGFWLPEICIPNQFEREHLRKLDFDIGSYSYLIYGLWPKGWGQTEASDQSDIQYLLSTRQVYLQPDIGELLSLAGLRFVIVFE